MADDLGQQKRGKSALNRQTSSMSRTSCHSRTSSCASKKDVPCISKQNSAKQTNGNISRELTRTDTQVNIKGMGSKTATLYLSQSHSKVKLPSSPERPRGIIRQKTSSDTSQQTTGTRSRQTTFMSQDNGFSEPTKLKRDLKREFTFTGYDIMEDCDPPVPLPTDPEEIERHGYVNVYINACKSLGITPVTFIVNSLMAPKLVMRSRSVGSKAARAIFIALVGNQRICGLDLEDNWLGAEGASAIAELLPQNNLITEINISENRIGGDGIRALAEVMQDNQTVRKLNISGSELHDHDAKYLAEIIENNVWLRELRASHNKFGEVGGLYLGPAIANNDTLELLDLSWNHLRRQGAQAVAAGLEDNGGLLMLDLSWNGLSRAGCRTLGLSLAENYTLEHLDLTCNRVDAIAVGSLLEGLRWNESLITLRLGQNPITPDVALLILKTVEKAPNSVLRELDLTDVVVDEEFVTSLKTMQQKRVLRARTGPIINKGEGILTQDAGTFLTNNPMQAMFDFMNERGYRVIDLFKRYDTDNSHTISTQDFTKGLLNVHLPLTVGQLEELVSQLDSDKDGKIELRDLTEAETNHRRKMFRRKQKLAVKEKSSNKKRTKAKTRKKRGLDATPDFDSVLS
ncbi:leucine-rich repeat-containing protein 74A-like [Haliotis rufescens]|uniref:leucine-rich repeat-containing protein 74A-like n=1 Tax=Haliotis rufescens TaxID=6454 RepID=UPI00201EFD5E|nr:leucine-rich repeat-containing protein 74A-like [Haliotis rufescens]